VTISGNVYEVSDPVVFGTCQPGYRTLQAPGTIAASLTGPSAPFVRESGGLQAQVDSAFSPHYAITRTEFLGGVTFTIDPFTGFDRECNNGTWGVNPLTSDQTVNFYYTAWAESWFQTDSGNIGVNNGNLRSIIPNGEVLSTNSKGSSGVLTYSSGLTLNGQPIGPSGDWRLVSTYTPPPEENYAFFTILFNRYLQAASGDIPTTEPSPFSVYQFASAPNLISAPPLTIAAGNKVVVLVDDDVVINENVIVPTGSFFALIVSGNIIIAEGVTRVEGIYVADGTITIDSSGDIATEVAFEGEGTFAAWSGFSLERDLGSINGTTPAEKFFYRPDFMIYAPVEMRQSSFEWREVQP
jgi:hypothetical protein